MAALHARCFTTPRPWQTDEFAVLLADPNTFTELSPSGFALGRVVAGEAELLTLAVALENRREGQGHALLRRYEASARSRGASESFLEVSADNMGALSLYDRAGYQRVGSRSAYYRCPDGGRCDAIVLRRSL